MELFNYETHPEWKLWCDVIHCSCAVPVIFTPFYFIMIYYDGSFISNYPVDTLLKDNLDSTKTSWD